MGRLADWNARRRTIARAWREGKAIHDLVPGEPAKVHQRTLLTDDGAMLRVREFPSPTGDSTLPTVVLAHGWTLTYATWQPVIDALQALVPVRVVAYDQRGHGDSVAGPPNVPIRQLGHDLHTVIAASAPEGEIVLAGHSMGGMTLMAYAGLYEQEYAARVRGAVLVATASGRLKEMERHGAAALMRRLSLAPPLRLGRLMTVRGQERLLFGDDPRLEDVIATRAQVARTSLPTFGQFYVAFGDHDEEKAVAVMGRKPLRIIVGTKDRLTPVRYSRWMAEQAPSGQLTIVPGNGHMLPYEATDQVVALIREVLGA
ncbi:alpha/beta fold hydrolase [Actinomycetota bacterium]|nr:alpha/beta hydrolase [Micrococcales bacterium]